MTKTVTLETAVLADAVMRAARIAPTKGAAWDKAMGILIDVRTESKDFPVRVSATDLDVTYYQRVGAVEVGDENMSWRVPSAVISGWLANLPMSAGKQIVLTEEDRMLVMQAGRSKTRLRLYPADTFPKIQLFDPKLLADVPNFARRVQQVAWAALPNHPGPLAGIFITGEQLIACDRTRVAFMPCAVPTQLDAEGRPTPFSAPLTTLVAVLRNVDDVRLRVTDRRLEIMPDADTQMTASLYAEPYPDVRLAISTVTLDCELSFNREELMDALSRMLVLVKGERYPKIEMSFQKDKIDMKMSLPDVGDVEDAIDVLGGPEKSFNVLFSPTNLLGVVSNGMREHLNLHFTPDAKKPVKLTDESGFECWLMPVEQI